MPDARRVSLSILDTVSIASPCPVKWESMRGDERKRFCDHCSLHVHNTAGMGRKEAEALIFGAAGADKPGRQRGGLEARPPGGSVCIRLYRRADGTVLTKDCPVGRAALHRRLAARAVRTLGLVACSLVAAAAWARGEIGGGSRLRAMHPFDTVAEWLHPTPAGVPTTGVPAMGKVIMGAAWIPPQGTTAESVNIQLPIDPVADGRTRADGSARKGGA